jgi:hypothetical protein
MAGMECFKRPSQLYKDSAGNLPGTSGNASVRSHNIQLVDCHYCGTLFRPSRDNELYCAFCQKEMSLQSAASRQDSGNNPLPF